MASVTCSFRPLPAAGRREEILQWHSALPGLGASQLGVARGADPAAIKAAFESLARPFHPDSLTALRRALASEPGHPEALLHLWAVASALDKRRRSGAAPEAGRPGLVARLLNFRR